MTTTGRLRKLIGRGQLLLVPFTYDGFTARIAQEVGFEAVYMSGFGTSMSKGMPDVGLLTQTEMIQNASIDCFTVSGLIHVSLSERFRGQLLAGVLDSLPASTTS